MKLTDYAVVRAFAEKAVENAKQQRNQQIKATAPTATVMTAAI